MPGEFPSEPDADEAIAAANKLFAKPCLFEKSAVRIDDLPDDGVVEVAFAGRSNVGKSSLLNALIGRRDMARTSNTPGRTQALNLFNIADGALRLVDMPGYGYAKAPKTLVDGWNRLIQDYLRGRVELRRLCLLIDARRGVGPGDQAVMDGLDSAAVSYQVVLTKSDKLKPAELERVRAATEEALKKRAAARPEVLVTSSQKSRGIVELRAALVGLARPAL